MSLFKFLKHFFKKRKKKGICEERCFIKEMIKLKKRRKMNPFSVNKKIFKKKKLISQISHQQTSKHLCFHIKITHSNAASSSFGI